MDFGLKRPEIGPTDSWADACVSAGTGCAIVSWKGNVDGVQNVLCTSLEKGGAMLTKLLDTGAPALLANNCRFW